MANPASLLRRIPLAPVVALMFGGAGAALVAATPQWMFENILVSAGLAQPPVGSMVRLIAVVAAFVVAAGVSGGLVMLGELLVAMRRGSSDRAEAIAAFAEALPKEGGRRRPISADKELGAPLMSDAALATVRPETAVEPVPAAPTESAPAEVEPAPAALIEPAPLAEQPIAPETPEAADVQPETEAPEPVSAADVDAPQEDELLLETPVLAEELPLIEDAVTRESAEIEALHAPIELAEFDLPADSEEAVQLERESSIDALIRRLEAGLARRGLPVPPGPSSASPPPAQAVLTETRHDWLVRDDGASDDDAPHALRTMAGR